MLSQNLDKILNHWNHQKKCLFSYVGCVSWFFFIAFKLKPKPVIGFSYSEKSPIHYMTKQQLAFLFLFMVNRKI